MRARLYAKLIAARAPEGGYHMVGASGSSGFM
jgi:hypothetical protein